jgi:hypothetical protein
MNKVDRIGAHIFYKKRNEEPYIVEASAAPENDAESDDEDGYLLPTLSLASAVSAVSGSVSAVGESVTNSVTAVGESVTNSVTAVAGTSVAAPTQAMSLGYGASE